LGEEAGYRVESSCANCRPDGSYDAAFSQSDSTAEEWKHLEWPRPSMTSVGVTKYTNVPGQNVLRERLVQKLLSHCKENLPEHLMPCSLVVVGTLP